MPANNDPLSDVTDLKAEIRSTHQRLDALRDKMDQNTTFLIQRMDGAQAELRKEISALRGEMTGSMVELRKEISAFRGEMTGSVAELRKEMTGSMAEVRQEMTGSMAEVRKDIASLGTSLDAAKIWAMTLCYTVAAAILFVIARALKWI